MPPCHPAIAANYRRISETSSVAGEIMDLKRLLRLTMKNTLNIIFCLYGYFALFWYQEPALKVCTSIFIHPVYTLKMKSLRKKN